MAKTIQQLYQQAEKIMNMTTAGGNTKTIVGGEMWDIVQKLEESIVSTAVTNITLSTESAITPSGNVTSVAGITVEKGTQLDLVAIPKATSTTDGLMSYEQAKTLADLAAGGSGGVQYTVLGTTTDI